MVNPVVHPRSTRPWLLVPMVLLGTVAAGLWSGGCRSNVGQLSIDILTSPDPDQQPLRRSVADVRVSVVSGSSVIARGLFDVKLGQGRLIDVPVGEGLQVVVEGLDPQKRVVSHGRTVPLKIHAGNNSLSLFVGLVGQFSFTPAAEPPTADAGSTTLFDLDGSSDTSDTTDAGATDAGDGDAATADAGGDAGSAGDSLPDAPAATDTGSPVDAETDSAAPSRDSSGPMTGPPPGMRAARAFHAATPLRGDRLLLCGGIGSGVWRPESEPGPPEVTASAELVDENALTFSAADCADEPGSCLQRGRTGHTTTQLPSGNVLVAGGSDSGGSGSDGARLVGEAEIFDSGKLSFFPGPTLLNARTGHAAALSGNAVVLAGGRGKTSVLTSVERYERDLSAAPQLRDARRDFALVALRDGTLLAIGGFDQDGRPLASTEVLKPGAPSWAAGPRLEVARAHLQAVLLPDDSVLVVGGLTETSDGSCARRQAQACTAVRAIELIGRPTAKHATRIGELNLGRWAHTATRLTDGTVLVVGGFAPNLASAPAASTEEIHIAGGGPVHIKQGQALGMPRAGHSASLLRSGLLLVAGGVSAASGVLTVDHTAEVFVPAFLALPP